MTGRGTIKQRIFTALVALPLLVLCVWYANYGIFAGVIFIVTALALHEFFAMALPVGRKLENAMAVVAGVACSVGVVYSEGHQALLLSLVAPALFLFLVYLFRFRDIPSVAKDLALSLLGVVYIPLLLSHATMLRGLPAGKDWVLLVLAVVMASDTLAYFVGKGIGKHRLYEAVSPNKTIEGALGGLAGSVIGAALCQAWFFPELQFIALLAFGLIVGLFSQLGDLVESLFKRSFGVKDSGTMIPGHGGLLDRLDSLLFAFPVAFYYALWVYA